MLNVVKEAKGDALLVKLSGSIEESVNFEALIGPTPSKLIVNCKEIPRINSVGVKAWIKYFGALQQKGTQLTLLECSAAIVEQINLISNFSCGAAVESVYVPFSCGSCGAELFGLFPTETLKKNGLQVPSVKCTKCGGQAEFDDIPEEYFGFLQR
jgi:anti-anti-sigma regulatory factor